MAPKVFVSHASEDKKRFVIDFATKLYAKGIKAWVDRWEILPGDSLVDKIFEEGIGQAQAVIVVVSEHSVNKPWVREELNAGVVRQINGASKLIPVVIGDVENSHIPESLKTTAWERVKDLNNYDAELERIVAAIYNHREGPTLGTPPGYAQSGLETVPGLNPVDSLILKLCCELAIEKGHREFPLQPQAILEAAEVMNVHPDQIVESVQILDGRGYLDAIISDGENVESLSVTERGFEKYASTYVRDYRVLVKLVGLQILNHDKYNSHDIADVLGKPLPIVEHVLNQFKNRRYIDFYDLLGGPMVIHSVSPELKRWLLQQS